MRQLLSSARVALTTLRMRRAFLAEGVDFSSILAHKAFPIRETPFRHVVLDDFLKPEAYKHILTHFNAIAERGFSNEFERTKFHPFPLIRGKFEYDGYLHIPDAHDPQVPRFMYTVAWNLLFSSLFKRPTGWCTSLAYHYHPAGDRTGFVHSDFTSKQFSTDDRLSNGVIYRERTAKGVAGEFVQRRTIALIYYLGNDDWKEGDGGETALYRTATGEPEVLIEPKNNRLLAFEISPKSFHAFQSNKTPRMSVAQWFHVDETYADMQYGNRGTQ